MTDALAGHVPRVRLEELRRMDSKLDGKTYHDKPTLRIGSHDHAGCEPCPDRPLRLVRNWNGKHYWTMTSAGQYHWWGTVKSTEDPKSGENRVPGSGTHNGGFRYT